MRILLIALIVLFQFNLTGCAGGAPPVTVESFRKGASGSEKESFEVNRNFNGVADTFKRKSAECLDTTVTMQAPGQAKAVTNWNPSFVAARDNAELHLRRAHNESDKGQLVMVVDLAFASLQRTRVDIYKSAETPDVILRAVRKWATGKDIGGCPDMTQAAGR